MSRVKRGTTHNKKRRRILKSAKGYRLGRKNRIKAAKEANLKAGAYAYRDRRNKKRTNRRLWQLKINAACRQNGTKYSEFIGKLKKENIEVDRKILANLAENHAKIFTKIVKSI